MPCGPGHGKPCPISTTLKELILTVIKPGMATTTVRASTSRPVSIVISVTHRPDVVVTSTFTTTVTSTPK